VRLEGLGKYKNPMTSKTKNKTSSSKYLLHPVYCRLTITNILRRFQPEFGKKFSGFIAATLPAHLYKLLYQVNRIFLTLGGPFMLHSESHNNR
jgi:hypothetical protein